MLVPNWVLGKPAAFCHITAYSNYSTRSECDKNLQLFVTSPLTPITLHEASVTSGSTAQVAENRKHVSNDAKCSSLGECVYLWQLRLMVVGVLKHRQTFLDLRRALQLDKIVVSPRPLCLSMAG